MKNPLKKLMDYNYPIILFRAALKIFPLKLCIELLFFILSNNLTTNFVDLLTTPSWLIIGRVCLKQKYNELPLNEFWLSLTEEYSNLSKLAIHVIHPFTTTYLCEAGFSYYAATKSKYRKPIERCTRQEFSFLILSQI
mgnify:CR=1 FL=1